LDVIDGHTAIYQERVEKIKKAYEQLKGEFLPTSLEISEKTGIYLQKVTEICRDQNIKLLHQNWSGLKVMYQHLKDLMNVSVDVSETVNSTLQDYVNTMGYYLSHNTFRKYRHILEKMKLIPESRRMRERLMPRKYLKYQESYLKLVKNKMKDKEKIILKRIAEELSEEFDEEVPEHRISELREITGIPILLDNETRYKNIVKIYEKHPEMQMEDWAEESKVSIGFLYDALRQFKKLPGLKKKFNVPDEMLSRLKTKENPMVKAFRAIGNTNRVKILKCLIEGDDITLDEILERVGYENKWRDTFEYHLEVLEDAGIVSLSYYNNNINLTSLGEDISSHIKAWDTDGIVPEDIFGPGYNKPLFALAISGGDIKALKEIVKFMRELKGHTPIDVPSAKARERYPVDKRWGKNFKRYLNNFLGKYQIKEEHLQFLGPLILNVRDFFSTSHISIPHLCKIKEVEYGRVRDITLALVDRGDVDELYLQVPQEQALKYMNFIKDNFYAICERMKLQIPQKNLKLEYNRSNEIYSLKLS
jgi:DNA-binding transcriptional ArsR family regulator